MNNQKVSGRYMMAVIIIGFISLIAAFVRLPIGLVDVYVLILCGLTILFGSRITIPIPRFKSHIAVSDTFIFLVLLLYGGEFAIILSAVEAFASSWRFCNKKITVFFNAATLAISTTFVVLVLNLLGLYSDNQLHGQSDNRTNFVVALSVIALTQFAVNTSLAAIHDALKNSLPLWETWKSKYIWTFFSYFIGAGAAGILVQLADTIGFGIIFATFPVIFFVFLSYRMYMKNVEIATQQAEQAERYAKILETQSEALKESEERFRSAFDYAPIGIGLLAPTGSWLKVNQALTDILGYSADEFLSMDFQAVTSPDDLGQTLIKVHELLTGEIANCQMEQRYIHKTGRIVWTSWSVSTASDTKSKQPNLIFQIQDITGKKLTEEKLQRDATHDALTGLPNRAFFMERLSAALAKVHQMEGYKASILFIDLDRFKYVNDSLGHLIGDQLLKGIAERLRKCLRPSDIVARLGGDEFTILVEGGYDIEEVTRIAERIQKKFSIAFELNGNEVFSSASIGILHASRNHLTSEDMMRDADTAMYQAKRAGKARHAVFDEKMFKAARETLQLETDLRRAVERGEITVHYQPIYSLESETIEGFESLARWHHKELGKISPSKFIPVAEEIGLIDRLCEHVLQTACREIGSLQELVVDGRKPTLSVNLSCKQFAQTSMVHNVERILAENHFSPHLLKFEITESVFVEHQAKAIEMLQQLRDSGIDINIDDFGTGYSNLSFLVNMPISTLKIDRSFVSMINEDGGNDEIVRAIVSLARTLNLKVVAEGIETASQLAKLKELGCESGQGFYFAAPMAFADLCEFLRQKDTFTLPYSPYDHVPEISAIQ